MIWETLSFIQYYWIPWRKMLGLGQFALIHQYTFSNIKNNRLLMGKQDNHKKMLENRKNRKEFKIQKSQGNAKKRMFLLIQSLKMISINHPICHSSKTEWFNHSRVKRPIEIKLLKICKKKRCQTFNIWWKTSSLKKKEPMLLMMVVLSCMREKISKNQANTGRRSRKSSKLVT